MRGVIGTMLVAGLLSAIALAFATPAKGFIYWANGSSIGRANNDGSGPNPNFITGQAEPCGLAVDSQHIYWANQAGGSIGRGNLDGTGINPNFIATDALPCGVALDGTHVWWANQLVPGGANTPAWRWSGLRPRFLVQPERQSPLDREGRRGRDAAPR